MDADLKEKLQTLKLMFRSMKADTGTHINGGKYDENSNAKFLETFDTELAVFNGNLYRKNVRKHFADSFVIIDRAITDITRLRRVMGNNMKSPTHFSILISYMPAELEKLNPFFN